MCELFIHEEVRRLLHNKYVAIIGGSIQRGMYKDLVLFLQSNQYLSLYQMRQKGEFSHCNDKLIEGGQFGEMKNCVSFREVREYCTDTHLVRFFFATRVYSDYLESVIQSFGHDPRPDVIIMNCCLWDIAENSEECFDAYKSNLETLMSRFNATLPESCLVVWLTTMPTITQIAMGKTKQKKTGGTPTALLTKRVTQTYPEQEFLHNKRRLDIMAANMCMRQIVADHGYDILDVHFFFRREIHRRIFDGIHWDMTAHRRMSNLVLTHIADAWGVPLPNRVQPKQPTPPMTVKQIPKPVKRRLHLRGRRNKRNFRRRTPMTDNGWFVKNEPYFPCQDWVGYNDGSNQWIRQPPPPLPQHFTPFY